MYNFETTDDKARLISDLALKFGWDADLNSIVKRVNEINQGVVQEDELIFLLNWSGKCSICHKVDQAYITNSAKSKFSIPDLFVELEVDGEKKKFYIEVKTSKKNKLSWTEKYYKGLVSYSESTGIPILIAWKWKKFNLWSIFPIEEFKKGPSNYKIDLNTSMTKSVFSNYFGDCLISLPDEIGFHMRFKKLELTSKDEEGVNWKCQFDKAYFTGRHNAEIESNNIGIIGILFCLPFEEKVSETDDYIIRSFIPEPNKSIFAQQIPIMLAKLMNQFKSPTIPVNWLSMIQEEKYPMKYQELMDYLKAGVDEKLVNHVLFTIPNPE